MLKVYKENVFLSTQFLLKNIDLFVHYE